MGGGGGLMGEGGEAAGWRRGGSQPSIVIGIVNRHGNHNHDISHTIYSSTVRQPSRHYHSSHVQLDMVTMQLN